MHKTNLRLIPALIAIAFSGSAAAAGFQLLEQNASGLGNAYAGSAAVAENASTIFYNPAGMTQLKDVEVSSGVSLVSASYKFTNNGSSTGTTLVGDADGGTDGYIPNAYLSWRVAKDFSVGLGIGAPFGLMTDYANPWTGAAQSLKFQIKTINVNPSVAWRANDWLSLGAGVSYQTIDAEYVRAVGTTAPFSGATATLKLNDSAWGWNAGALFTLSPTTKIGVSYRSTVKYETTGNVAFTAPLGAASGDVKASVKLPDTFILSATQKLGDQWELLGDVSWTGWSSIPKIDVLRASGAPLQTLDTDFRDTWRVAAGANYQIDNAWKLKFGLAYDQTPVKGAGTRLVSLPDNDRIWLSVGTQWKPAKNTTIDVGATYLLIKDTEINNDQSANAPSRGIVKGTYDDKAFILGAQLSMAF